MSNTQMESLMFIKIKNAYQHPNIGNSCSVLDKDRKTTYEKWVFYCSVRSLSVSLLTSQQEKL